MLLAACCLLLLAAKPGRSTLDTKKGYKTKTGSTSSVTTLDTKKGYETKTGSTSSVTLILTLTQIKTEYWDGAGGGGNISYEW